MESPAPATESAAAAPAGRSPWLLAIITGLVIMALVNFAFIYVAVSGADDVVPSYNLEPR